jgi:hypothetical protein
LQKDNLKMCEKEMSPKLRVTNIIEESRMDESIKISKETKPMKLKSLVQVARMDEQREKMNAWAESLGYKNKPNKLSYEV